MIWVVVLSVMETWGKRCFPWPPRESGEQLEDMSEPVVTAKLNAYEVSILRWLSFDF